MKTDQSYFYAVSVERFVLQSIASCKPCLRRLKGFENVLTIAGTASILFGVNA